MATTVTLTTLSDWLKRFQAEVSAQQEYLTELDSAIGDADHGANMVRGMTAVVEKVLPEPAETVGELLKKVGMMLVTSVGGASGPLYGTFFLRMAVSCGPATELDTAALGAALRAGVEGIVQRGKPELGDKTMYDALHPALSAYDVAAEEGKSLAEAVAAAAAAGATGRDATVDLVARKGRASYLGERSVGHIDPGSASAVLLLDSLAQAVAAS